MEHLRITVEGKVYDVIVERADSNEGTTPAPAPVPPVRAAAAAPAPAPAAPRVHAASGDVTSPLAGLVKAVEVGIGANVKEGDLVITLEAMKMYTAINATSSGTIKAIHVKAGDAVEEGQPLYSIE